MFSVFAIIPVEVVPDVDDVVPALTPKLVGFEVELPAAAVWALVHALPLAAPFVPYPPAIQPPRPPETPPHKCVHGVRQKLIHMREVAAEAT